MLVTTSQSAVGSDIRCSSKSSFQPGFGNKEVSGNSTVASYQSIMKFGVDSGPGLVRHRVDMLSSRHHHLPKSLGKFLATGIVDLARTIYGKNRGGGFTVRRIWCGLKKSTLSSLSSFRLVWISKWKYVNPHSFRQIPASDLPPSYPNSKGLGSGHIFERETHSVAVNRAKPARNAALLLQFFGKQCSILEKLIGSPAHLAPSF